jgi:hypothetical protein
MENRVIVTDLFESLFPDGNIPSISELEQKVLTPKFTMRDAIILKAHYEGMTGFSTANVKANSELVKNLENAFPRKAKSGGNASNIFRNVQAFRSVLDKPYGEIVKFKVEDTAKEISKYSSKPKQASSIGSFVKNLDNSIITTAIKNATGGKQEFKDIFKRTTTIFDTNKSKPALALDFEFDEPKRVWTAITTSARNMAVDSKYGEELAKVFLFNSLSPMRQEDILQITTDRNIAQKDQRFWLHQLENGQWRLQIPTALPGSRDRGKKGVVPFTLTKFQENLLLPLIKKAKTNEAGRLFPNVTTGKLGSAMRTYFLKALKDGGVGVPPELANPKMLRKIGASTIADFMDDDMAAIILAHYKLDSKNLKSNIAAITNRYYKRGFASSKDRSRDPISLVYTHMENEIARSLGLTDVNEIGASLAGLEVANYKKETIPVLTQDDLESNRGKTEVKQRSPREIELAIKNEELRLEKNAALLENQIAELKGKTQERVIKTAETKKEYAKIRAEGKPVKEGKINPRLSNFARNLMFETGTTVQELENLNLEEQNALLTKRYNEMLQPLDEKKISQISQALNIPEDEISGKSPKELAQYLKDSNVKVHPGIRRTLGKIIPPLAVALTMVGVAEAASSPLEEYELGPEDQNILTRITDPFIGDDPAKRKAARLFEETYSPFPFTVVKRKGEDVVPLDQTIGEQMRKLKDKIGPDYKESEEKIAEEEAKKDIPKEVYVPDLAIMQSDLENF